MPKQAPLPQVEQELLRLWIAEGANEEALSPQSTPTPIPERPYVRWTEVNEKIILPRCLGCHRTEVSKTLTDLSTYLALKDNIGSILVLTVANAYMPPPPQGTPQGAANPNQLSRNEKEILSNWVVDGMQP